MKKFVLLLTLTFSMFSVQHADAQLSSILSKVSNAVSSVTGKSTTTDITGTWKYSGSAVEFESSNLLKSAGGSVVANQIQSKLDTQLQKIGITSGKMTFTFNNDSTFTVSGVKSLKGTYTFDSKNNQVTLTFSKLMKVSAKTTLSSSDLSLLFKADKLLSVLSTVASKANNSTLSTISSLAGSYDGMMLGFKFAKQ